MMVLLHQNIDIFKDSLVFTVADIKKKLNA
jgi:hypothetical protein